MSMAEVCVVGAGGHAKVVVSTLQAAGHALKGLYDDAPEKWGRTVLGVPVVGPVADLEGMDEPAAVLGIGDGRVRSQLARRLHGARWITVVHPGAIVHESARLGAGTVVFAGAVVQASAVVGAHCIVNTGATIDHDCVLGDYVHLGPGSHLSGGVRIGDGAFLGAGVVAIPLVQVGAWSVVGAGSVVTLEVPAGVVAVGAPARVSRRTHERL